MISKATQTEAKLPVALGERIDVHPVVERLRPLIEASERQIEDDCALPPELVEEMWDAGIFITGLPREYGGLELHPLDYEELQYELARINGSVGWIAQINNHGLWMLEPEIMEEIHSRGRWLLAGSFGRIGTAVPVEGGYRFTGKWNFASGAPWANYLLGAATVATEDGETVLDADGKEPLFVAAMFHKEAVNYLGNWDSLGLRGTGSGEFEADDVFVEEGYVWKGMPEAFLDRPLYSTEANGTAGASALLGMAQGMIDSFIALGARKAAKSFNNRQGSLGREQLHQVTLAHADGLLRAARTWCRDLVVRLYEAPAMDLDEKATAALQMEAMEHAIYSGQITKQVVNLIFEQAGSDSVVKGRGLERHFRDAMTAAQHSLVLPVAYQPIGEYYFTRDLPDAPTPPASR